MAVSSSPDYTREGLTCPNHPGHRLRTVHTQGGVAVKKCDLCGGVWLDRGQIYQLADAPSRVVTALRSALDQQISTDRPSPRTGTTMTRLTLGDDLDLYRCRDTGGLWLDAETVARIDPAIHHFRIAFGPKTRRLPRGPLAVLPNLILRSGMVLAYLYLLVFLVLYGAGHFIPGVSAEDVMAVAAGGLVLQFLLGPYILDLVLRWFYSMRRVDPRKADPRLADALDRLCEANDLKFPKLGIIDDGAPQAFTYGRYPGDARLVVSRGLLEILDADEIEAVVAHEIGHVVHWDMALMTVVQFVPMVLYYIFRKLSVPAENDKSDTNDDRDRGLLLAFLVYAAYWLSAFAVLWFSRTREYHADRFAGQATGNPNALARALIKIGYGLAGEQRGSDDASFTRRDPGFYATGAMGIFNRAQAKSLAVTGYTRNPDALDNQRVKGAMRWDFWNPWAKWYEINATHPLIAKRLVALSRQAERMGQEPYVVFDETRPGSFWREMLVDVVVYALPFVMLGGVPLVIYELTGTFGMTDITVGPTAVFVGGALLLKFAFSYRYGFFPEMTIAALLNFLKVSHVRPVPCTLRGTIIGRGVPGLIFSEDFVMRDDTGIIFLDLRQPMQLWEKFFGLMKARAYQGRYVTVRGWYRRAPVPYVEIMSITDETGTLDSYMPLVKFVTALGLILFGALALLTPGDMARFLFG